ncbi:hypothetical protein [Flammeovirga sp. EKP202]|uniref:hypothetical protein n=1 Tax=Flammeovirga sp. EKP202 TaxID=2770592 RepID=UPI00165EC4CC|nr:hypothetical protein [Flammeovirga sp. EKP202]MBD0401229.1 hypothetical protein [Flammeovirga sp. EKP202]
MNKQIILTFLSTIFLIISCNDINNGSTQDDPISSKEKWLHFHHITADAFDIKGMPLQIKPEEVRYGLFEEEEKMYSKTFMYSPDSTYYIDMDSYGLEIAENDDGSLEYLGREIDIKVQLVNVLTSDSSAIELMMCGTSCFPEEAYWENKTTVSILGLSTDRSEKVYPTIWTYDLTNGAFVKYISEKEVIPTDENYFEKYRLNKLLSLTM